MISVPYEVKKALRDGMLRKNYRFLVLNDDGTTDFTIDNDTLVSESVSIDERMCSGDTLKFGLCEGSSLEFQYFNHPNIYERRIQAFVDVQYLAGVVGRINASGSFTVPVNGSYTFEVKKGSATGLYITFAGGGDIYVDFVLGQTTDTEELEAGDVVTLNNPSSDALFEVSTDMWDTIPMGFFDVKKCSRQASTGIMKVTAYNKLMSEYLDAKANELIETVGTDMSDGTTTTLYSILQKTLNDYGIDNRTETEIGVNVTPGTESQEVSSVSIKLVGYSGTYYPAIHTNSGWRLGITTAIAEGAMVNLDLSDYISLLQRSMQSMKSAFFSNVVDAETKWASAVRDSGLLQHNAAMTVSFYDDIYAHFYTLSSEVRALPAAHNHSIENITNLYNVRSLSFAIPYKLYAVTSNHEVFRELWSNTESLSTDVLNGKIKMIEASELTNAELINVDVNTLPDVTLRELQSAVYEMTCQFGQLSRITDLFSGVELNNGGLYPAEDLYPADNLYPSGASMSASKAMYSQLWADEGNVRKWRYLIITYKGLDEDQNEKDYTLQRTVNADGTDDYNMSDNWLFRNLIWTAQQVGNYADAMVTKMQNNEWFPFEMWCAGLPYLETGDQIEIPLNGEVYKSYILQRQLKGIQNLQDTYINGTLDIF